MIVLGCRNEKQDIIEKYIKDNAIKKVVVISPEKIEIALQLSVPFEVVSYELCIEYVYYYRLLQEIDKDTLIIINECLRSQKRNGELTFNVIRVYLQNTHHKIVFQYLPQIDSIDDFMTLFDWDTDSRYKKMPFSADLLQYADIHIFEEVFLHFEEIAIPTSKQTMQKYQQEKQKLIENIGVKDPHTIPRNLHLIGAKDKLSCIDITCYYIMRSNKYKMPNVQSYKEKQYNKHLYVIFEWCHNYIDFIDFAYLSGQTDFSVMTTKLKVDSYYLTRYREWAQRITETYKIIKQYAKTNI